MFFFRLGVNLVAVTFVLAVCVFIHVHVVNKVEVTDFVYKRIACCKQVLSN